MSKYNEDLKLKLAWQTAYELRTCPPSEILYATKIDDNLRKHLSTCVVCRENRELALVEKDAWQGLFKMMSSSVMSTNNDTATKEGQVWSLKQSFGEWQQDGRYFSPPLVLLLRKQETSLWKVAQLFCDQRLAGDGDVILNDSFGFAEGWNCYLVENEKIDGLLGMVTPNHLQQVLTASGTQYTLGNNESILSRFRNIEREVGTAFGMTSLKDPTNVTEKARELIPGMEFLISGAKDYLLDIATGTLGILSGTFRPALVVRGRAFKSPSPKLTEEQKQLIASQCPVVPIDFKISESQLLITLKWLNELEPKQFMVEVIANESILTDVNVSFGSKGIVKISSSDKRLPELRINETTNIRLSVSSDLISITLVRKI